MVFGFGKRKREFEAVLSAFTGCLTNCLDHLTYFNNLCFPDKNRDKLQIMDFAIWINQITFHGAGGKNLSEKQLSKATKVFENIRGQFMANYFSDELFKMYSGDIPAVRKRTAELKITQPVIRQEYLECLDPESIPLLCDRYVSNVYAEDPNLIGGPDNIHEEFEKIYWSMMKTTALEYQRVISEVYGA